VSALNRKVALAAGVGTLTAVMLGGAAFAAFAPTTYEAPSSVDRETAAAAPANGGTDKLESVLDGLISKGVITRAQADAILAAVRTAAPRDRGGGAAPPPAPRLARHEARLREPL
jgi:hypothetical protein